MKEITIQVPDGKTAEWVDGVLRLVDEKDARPVAERLKTFDDCLNALGEQHPLVIEYIEARRCDHLESEDLFAYLKLRIVTVALNEGWVPQHTSDETCYRPYFRLYTEKNIVAAPNANEPGIILLDNISSFSCHVYHAVRNGNIAFAYVATDYSHTFTPFGFGLYFKTKELAEYAGRQFIDIYLPFCL